jgi:hypothetical protein
LAKKLQLNHLRQRILGGDMKNQKNLALITLLNFLLVILFSGCNPTDSGLEAELSNSNEESNQGELPFAGNWQSGDWEELSNDIHMTFTRVSNPLNYFSLPNCLEFFESNEIEQSKDKKNPEKTFVYLEVSTDGNAQVYEFAKFAKLSDYCLLKKESEMLVVDIANQFFHSQDNPSEINYYYLPNSQTMLIRNSLFNGYWQTAFMPLSDKSLSSMTLNRVDKIHDVNSLSTCTAELFSAAQDSEVFALLAQVKFSVGNKLQFSLLIKNNLNDEICVIKDIALVAEYRDRDGDLVIIHRDENNFYYEEVVNTTWNGKNQFSIVTE